MACNHPAQLGGRNHCDSGGITYLICHVTLPEYVFKTLCDFREVSSYRHYGGGDKMFLIHHFISRDHVFKGLCDFMNGNFS